MTAAVRKRAAGSRQRVASSGAIQSRADTLLRQSHPDVWKNLLRVAHGIESVTANAAHPQDSKVSAQIYGVSDAAKLVGVNASTLVDWRKKGYLLPTFFVETVSGRQSLYTHQDIERGRQMKADSRPGLKQVYSIGWKQAHNTARRKLRDLYRDEHQEYVRKIKAGEI